MLRRRCDCVRVVHGRGSTGEAWAFLAISAEGCRIDSREADMFGLRPKSRHVAMISNELAFFEGANSQTMDKTFR